MELQYRGTTYTTTTTIIETSKLPVSGMYRGQAITFQTAKPQPIITQELTYRGITYNPQSGERSINSNLSPQQRHNRRRPAFS